MDANVTLKVTFDADLRRISVPTSISLGDLKKRLANMFANFEELKLQYSDDEGDRVTITSTDELEEAMRVAASTKNILRLFVSENKKKEEAKVAPVNTNVVHAAYCDNCNVTIRGIRYKCGNCEDFDLCEACEKLPNVHNDEHIFVKIVKPLPHFTHQRRSLLPPLYQPRWQRPHWGHWAHHHGQQQGQQVQQQGEEVKAPEQSRCPYVRRRWCRDVVPVQVNVANPEKAEEVKPEEPVIAESKQDEVKVEDIKEEVEPVEEAKPEEVKIEDVKEAKPVVEEPKRELTRFEQMLVALEDMGFNDRRQNIELLVRSGGNLDAVVQQLLGVSLNN
jgi:hypothetical protein